MRSRATSIALAAAIVIGLSGCSFTARQTVQAEYDPSDGFGTQVGDLEIENALIITDTAGDRGNLIASFVNNSSQNLQIVVSWQTESGDQRERNVYLSSGDSRTVGTASNPFIITDIDALPGTLFPIFFTYEGAEGDQLSVPVLENDLEAYAGLLPGEVGGTGGGDTGVGDSEGAGVEEGAEGSGTEEELETTDELETGEGTEAPGVDDEVADTDESESRE